MRPECIEAVAAALKRPLSKREAEAIEARVLRAKEELARTQNDWATLSPADQLRAAGSMASRQLIAEATRRRELVALQAAAAPARLAEMAQYMARHPKASMFDALGEQLRLADVAITGVHRIALSDLMEVLEGAQPGFMRLIGDPAFAREVVMEASGRDTGNARAKAGAQAWLRYAEGSRERFNRSGGDIGRLDYSYFPTVHDQINVRQAGRDAWVDFVLPRLGRDSYFHESGRRKTDDELREMLRASWETISSDGLNMLEPGKIPAGASALIADRGSEARVIHFSGPEAYLEYMDQFGRGSIFEVMTGHAREMAINTVILERFGPNADATFEFLRDTALKSGAPDVMHWTHWRVSSRDLWGALTERANQIYEGGELYARRAQVFQGLRNWQVVSKLQATLLQAMGDFATYYMTTSYNRAGFLDATRMLLRSFTPGAGTTEVASHMALVSENLSQDLSRWGSQMLRDGITGRLATTTMRVSSLNAFTNAIRRAGGMVTMGSIARILSKPWAALDEADHRWLAAKGIDEQQWSILQLADLEDWGGVRMLTPESVRAIPEQKIIDGPLRGTVDEANASLAARRARDDAMTRLFGAIVDESEYASLAPDLYTRAFISSLGQRGTWGGEIGRSMMLFKTFTMGVISRHYSRMLSAAEDGGGLSSAQYAALIFGGMTLMGGVSVMLRDLALGRDPSDPAEPGFWVRAVAAGGGMAFLGDILSGMAGSGRAVGGQSAAGQLGAAVLGPMGGTVADAVDLTLGNVVQAAAGEDTDFGAETLRFVRSHLPFVNLWYGRTLLDRAVLNDIQEQLSPGYLSRVRDRTRQNFGTEFWWEPGELMPERMPLIEIGR